jgi:hypothetical protein
MMVYIEHEGALFRGPSRSTPREVWREAEGKFVPYAPSRPPGVEWGEVIDPEAAAEIMGADAPAADPDA